MKLNLEKGPADGNLPILCNLQWAIARVLRVSGAADVIMKLKDEADDSDFPRVFHRIRKVPRPLRCKTHAFWSSSRHAMALVI